MTPGMRRLLERIEAAEQVLPRHAAADGVLTHTILGKRDLWRLSHLKAGGQVVTWADGNGELRVRSVRLLPPALLAALHDLEDR
jgi:hypothetical protein